MRRAVPARKWWPFHWYCGGCFQALALADIEDCARRRLPVRAWACAACRKAERYRRPPPRERACVRCGEIFRIGRTAMLCPQCFATADDLTGDLYALAGAELGVAVKTPRGPAGEP